MWFGKNSLVLKLLISVFLFSVLAMSHADRYKRPMQIHKVKRMGLEIWTEIEPEWKTELMFNGKKPIFVAHTPFLSYPPSGMTWVNHAEVQLADGEFPNVARSTLETVARNYRVSNDDIKSLEVTSANYGNLKGFEINFVGVLDNKNVDVKAFTGRAHGKGPVTMQVYAPVGKLKHMKEQIRRSWTNTRYLD